MTERPILNSPEPAGQGTWLDAYVSGNAPALQQPGQHFVNVNLIRGLIYRQRWLVVGVLFAAATLSLVVTLLMTPMYEATSKVSVKPFGQEVVDGQSDIGVPTNLIYEYINTMVERIKSREMAEVVVDDLKLADRQELLGKDIEQARAPGLTDDQWRASDMRAIPL